MPRQLRQDQEERFMNWAQERDRLFLSLRNASIPEKIQAYKRLEKRILKETHTAFERKEMQRRITEDLLRAASAGPWRGFAPYLRRMERLGYSSIFSRLLVCVLSAQAAKRSLAGVRKTASLVTDIERRTRGRKLHPAVQEEVTGALARARSLAGIDAGKNTTKGSTRQNRASTREHRERQ